MKAGEVVALVNLQVTGPGGMASALSTESADHLGLKHGDEVRLFITVIHVLPLKTTPPAAAGSTRCMAQIMRGQVTSKPPPVAKAMPKSKVGCGPSAR